MTELAQKIKDGILTARRAKDSFTVKTLSTLYGEIESKSKSANTEMADSLVISTVKKFMANNKETILMTFDESRKDDLTNENTIYEIFLPKQLSVEELTAILTECLIRDPGNMGTAMKHLKENYSGTYDGRVASNVVKDMLK